MLGCVVFKRVVCGLCKFHMFVSLCRIKGWQSCRMGMQFPASAYRYVELCFKNRIRSSLSSPKILLDSILYSSPFLEAKRM